MRKLALVTCLFVLSFAAFATTARATQPARESFVDSVTFTVTGICGFPLSVTASIRGTQTVFFDESGDVVKVHFHVVEQDTFSANGKTVTGESYTFNVDILFENGEVTSVLANGVAEKIRLPDGTLFLSAGQIDFLAQGVGFSISPDHGVTGDIDALCAALS